MALFDFLHRKHEEASIEVFIEKKAQELRIQELLIEHAIDLIAKTISKSEIQVFKHKGGKVHKEVDDVYYTLNVRPNHNQDGTPFMYTLVAKLLREGEALAIIDDKKDLYIADRWTVSNHIMNEKVYSNIVISDGLNELKLNKTFLAKDAIYLSLGDNRINDVLNSFYTDYAELITASVNGFTSSKYSKYKLILPTNTKPIINPKTGKQYSNKDYEDAITKGLFSKQDSVVSIPQSHDLEEVNTITSQTSEDTRNMIKDYGNKVAMAFNIPLDIYWGEKTEKSTGTNDFITFAVMPILSIVEDSFNAKIVEKGDYLLGSRIKFDKFTMKHFDIMDVAHSLDKLFAIGWSHNDLQEIMGQPIVEEEWANRHHVTKNYMDVDDPALKGGE